MRVFWAFLRDESGATAIEYGLITTLIAVALIGTFLTYTDAFKSAYEAIAALMTVAPSGGS